MNRVDLLPRALSLLTNFTYSNFVIICHVKSTTVQLDVGGTLYKVSLSLIENFPDSMLASIVSDKGRKVLKSKSLLREMDIDSAMFWTICVIKK